MCESVITVIQEYEQYMAEQTNSKEKYPLLENQVISLIASFNEGVEELDNVVGKIALYVDSPVTQGILFAPVRVGRKFISIQKRC